MKRDESGPRDLARNGAHFIAVLNQTKKKFLEIASDLLKIIKKNLYCLWAFFESL